VKGFIGNVLDFIDVCLFCTVGIMSSSGYWRRRGIVKKHKFGGKKQFLKNLLWMDIRVYIVLT
jgi:hypothetical protein